jgi:transcriptional regulator with XRE-family HTH domain
LASSAVPAIGERIREERIRKGVSARGLAREIGVSASLISQIETEKSKPSVSTLYAITTALGISVEDLFTARQPDVASSAVTAAEQPPTADREPLPEAGPPRPSGPVGLTAVDRRRRVGPIVRPAQREELTLDSGVVWELLGQVPDTHVEFGELILTLGFEEHRLGPGDAVSFDSTTPHGYRNDGTEPAVGVWFVLERTG